MLKPAWRHAARQLNASARSAAIGRRYAHTPAPFDWKDPLGSNNLYTEEELAIAETAESYCQERMLPRVLGTLSCNHLTEHTINFRFQKRTETKIMTENFSKKWGSWAFLVPRYKAMDAPA
jgi:hypothetical protein